MTKSRLQSIFRYNTIGYKIFAGMLFLTLLCMALLVFMIYSSYSELMRENEIKYNILATNTIQSKFDMTIEMIQSTSTTLLGSAAIRTELIRETTAGPPGIDLDSLVENILVIEPFIENVHVLDKSGLYYSSGLTEKSEEIFDKYYQHWDDASALKNLGGFWVTQGNAISYIRPVQHDRLKTLTGLIVLEIDFEYLREMFMLFAIKLNEKVLMADPSGNVLFKYPFATSFDPFLSQYPDLTSADFIQIEGSVYGVDSVIVSEKLKLADWRIIRIIQASEVTKQTRQLMETLKNAGIVLLFACLFFSFWITRVITKPVKALDDACTQAEQGNLDVRVDITSQDEFGKLGKTFNMMLIQLQKNLEEEIENQKRKAEMQFQILQAQINPHFLYNSLDSIRWLAVMKNISSIADMSTSLINLLKYNLTGDKPTTSLRDELESVQNYITIQKFRYSDSFSFKMQVDENALDCQVVRFILQPLVENSIVHGFEDITEGYSIRISVFFSDDRLHIKVIDNGVGMAPERTEELNAAQQRKHRFNHIGVANIRERIQLYFGNECELDYQSEPHVGTIARLVLPIVHLPEENSIS